MPGIPVVVLDRDVDELAAGGIDAERELDLGAPVRTDPNEPTDTRSSGEFSSHNS